MYLYYRISDFPVGWIKIDLVDLYLESFYFKKKKLG